MSSGRWMNIALIGLLMMGTPIVATAAPSADPLPYWQANDPTSPRVVDHRAWDQTLKTYLVTDDADLPHRFDYARMTSQDRESLARYVAGLQQETVTRLNRDEQRAFWINLYNAATVKLVLDHYPARSIRDIRLGGIFSAGPWDEKLFSIQGQRLSLNDVEHRILRPLWRDPRIHYAVNCASLSCPSLQPEAFTASNTDELLNRGARQYINSVQGLSFSGKTLVLSSIYTWFAADFGPDFLSVVKHLSTYAETGLRSRLNELTGSVRYEYDWSLNDVRKGAP